MQADIEDAKKELSQIESLIKSDCANPECRNIYERDVKSQCYDCKKLFCVQCISQPPIIKNKPEVGHMGPIGGGSICEGFRIFLYFRIEFD